MHYSQIFTIKNNQQLLIRTATQEDALTVIQIFNQTHAETDYLASYPDETSFTQESEGLFLQNKADSQNEVQLLAILNNKAVGLAGITSLGNSFKLKHRADLGISVLKDYWGQSIGTTLLNACIKCAKQAGYKQLELEVIADNTNAINLYKKAGFVEYGRNPRGFYSRTSKYQELVYMFLKL